MAPAYNRLTGEDAGRAISQLREKPHGAQATPLATAAQRSAGGTPDAMIKKTLAYKDPRLPPPVVIPDGPGWVSLLQSFNQAEAEALVAVVQTLCPHDAVPLAPYRRVICHFDRLVSETPTVRETFTSFLAMLKEHWELPFQDLAETYRVQTLKSIETTPQFFFVQRMAIRYFYDDVEIWAAFGYQGASVHLGGYVKRGFDDLDWLPPLPNDL